MSIAVPKKRRTGVTEDELAGEVKKEGLEQGADLVGVVRARDLAEHEQGIAAILPAARSIVVVAARHSQAAIRSPNNQVAQFDTIHTYLEAERAAMGTVPGVRGFPLCGRPCLHSDRYGCAEEGDARGDLLAKGGRIMSTPLKLTISLISRKPSPSSR